MHRVSVCVQQILAPRTALLQTTSCAGLSDVAREMAPTGKLRVALNMRNKLMVSGKTADGQPEGLAPSVAAAFAQKLGVPVEYLPYEKVPDIFKDAEADKWDLAMVGADPDRATFVDFTEPYAQIEATYAVPTTSGAQKCADIDKEGVKVAGCAGAAYVLWLQRNLKNAKLEIFEGHDATYEAFNQGGMEAVSGLRSNLKKDADKRPGTRILKDKFMAVEQAACTKKGRTDGFKMLSAFIDEAKKSGMILELMKKFKVDGELAVP